MAKHMTLLTLAPASILKSLANKLRIMSVLRLISAISATPISQPKLTSLFAQFLNQSSPNIIICFTNPQICGIISKINKYNYE